MTVRIIESDLNPATYLHYAIADNTSQRSLNLIETSRAYNLLAKLAYPDKTLIKSAAALGLPSNLEVINKIKSLCGLSARIQAAIVNETISLAVALELMTQASETSETLVSLFETLKLGLNKQREIMTLVKEIARREEIGAQSVLEDRHLQAIVKNPDYDRNQKSRLVRAYLKRRRFPQITEAETHFDNYRRRLNLGPNVHLKPPKDFEAPTYTFIIAFSSMDQLEALHSRLGRLLKSPDLGKIIPGKDKSSE